MSSNIYKTIIKRKLQIFVEVFANDSNKIFKQKNNTLIHPGEYGKYRENICKEILEIFLNKDVKISDGFIITSKNNISTQCDIIVYNSEIMPLISNDISKMFPVEEIRAIGEIKSNLNKTNFINALKKLANNKKLNEDKIGLPKSKRYNSKTYDTLPTFLICNKLEFDYNKVDLKEIYGDIPRQFWHNAILSIEDGFISYALDFRIASNATQDILKENGYDLTEVGICSYPYYFYDIERIETRENMVYVNLKDEFHHIICFFMNVVNLVKDCNVYEQDPIVYLGLNTKPFFFDT